MESKCLIEKKYKIGRKLKGWPRQSTRENSEISASLSEGLPKITVVTPSLNQGEFIEETILSVVNQNYPNLEYIVIDGGSFDQSVEVIKRHSQKITYWHSKSDQGQADAIATGFDMSTGDILCWLNSDDMLMPNSLWIVANYFNANKKTDFLYGNRFLIDENSKLVAQHVWFRFLRKRHWFEGLPLAQESSFWRRNIYFDVGGINRKLFFIMDHELFYRMWCRGRFAKINQTLGCLRAHDESKNAKHQEIRRKERAGINVKYNLQKPGTLARIFLTRWDRLLSRIEKMRSRACLIMTY